MEVPNKWMVQKGENPTNMDDLGVPYDSGTPTSLHNLQIRSGGNRRGQPACFWQIWTANGEYTNHVTQGLQFLANLA